MNYLMKCKGKIYCSIAIALLCASILLGCDDKKSYGVEEYPVVGYANTAGSWQITHIDGEPVEGDVYAYIRMERRMIEDEDVSWRAFQVYSTLSSAQPIEKTGKYILKTDNFGRPIIEGLYDYYGYWQKDFYYISVSGDGNTMTWIANDDPGNVIVHARVDDAVLDEIISQME